MSSSTDREEIITKLYLYARAIDAKDFDILRDIFSDDAIVDYAIPGGAQLSLSDLIPWLREALAMFRLTQHVISNPLIDVDVDAAASTAYLTAAHEQVGKDGRRTTFVDHGVYKDTWTRTAQGWRIRRRRLDRFFLRGDFQSPDLCQRYPTSPHPVASPVEKD
jgi:ketosteroid isomerase-like protein